MWQKQGEYVTDDFPTLLKFLKSDLLLNRAMATWNLFFLSKERKKETKQNKNVKLASHSLTFGRSETVERIFLLGGLENWSRMRQFEGRGLGDRGILP